jgi:biopolymer transport protein ExbB
VGVAAGAGILATVARAAETAGGEAARMSQYVSLKDLVDKGGILVYPLGAMSVVAVAFVIYFFVVLRREQVAPAALREDVLEKLEGGQWADARSACAYRPCAFAEITVTAIDYASSVSLMEPAMLKEIIEGEGARQASSLQSQTQYLMDVAVISPMLGLLGTVFGMMKSFNVVAFDLAKAKPMLLAGGVAEALITTAVGLMIGIPAMMFHAYFRGRTAKLVSELEVASSQVMAAMLKKRG